MRRNMPDAEEAALLRELVEYDHLKGVFRWRARRPDHFGTRFPERTAAGWNARYEGQEILLRSNGRIVAQVHGRRMVYTPFAVAAAIGVRLPEEIEIRRRARPDHMRRLGSDITGPDLLRGIFDVDSEGYLIWKHRTAIIHEALDGTARATPRRGGKVAPKFTRNGLVMFNRRFAGKRVALDRNGYIVVAAVLHVDPDVVRKVFGRVLFAARKERKPAGEPIEDDDLRLLFYLDPKDGKTIRHKPRSPYTWKRLAQLKCISAAPSQSEQMNWHEKGAFTTARPYEDRYKIGKRKVSAKRVKDVCTAASSSPF